MAKVDRTQAAVAGNPEHQIGDRTRRAFLRCRGLVGAMALLSACAPTAAPAPTAPAGQTS